MNDLKAYLDLKRRSGVLSSRIAAYVQEGLSTGNSKRSKEEEAARTALGFVLEEIENMEKNAGFVYKHGRMRLIAEDTENDQQN